MISISKGRLVSLALTSALVALSILAVPVAAATTTVVDCGAGADLQAAIDAASPGDTLLIKGTCVGSFRAVETGVTLEGRGRNPTLAGDPASTALIAGDITIKSLTISGGIQGIVVFAGSAGGFTMIHSAVTGNGEGIHAFGGTVDIRESSVSGNGGIGIFNQAVMTLTDSTVSNNAGGGIYNNSHLSGRGVLSVVDSTISGNTTSGDGGGIRNEWTLTITDSRIMNNTAAGSGGGNLDLVRRHRHVQHARCHHHARLKGDGEQRRRRRGWRLPPRGAAQRPPVHRREDQEQHAQRLRRLLKLLGC